MVSNKSIELFERLFLRQKAASYFDLLNQEDLTRQVRRLSAKLAQISSLLQAFTVYSQFIFQIRSDGIVW